MNVLSLFDGMSCGQIALNRLGINYENYYASEIDKYAIQITQKNYPNTIQIGDVTKIDTENLPKIDLLLAGSPCQGFSFAGKHLNFDDPRSALFWEFVKILKECKPKFFLLENVRMKKEFKDIISEEVGIQPIEINSALLSAQNRKRLYWTNIPNVLQPIDKGILLKDIVDADTLVDREKSFCLDAGYYKGISYEYYKKKSRRQIVFTPNYLQYDLSGKGYKSQDQRAFYLHGKHGTLPSSNCPSKVKVLIDQKKLLIRKLSPVECERLQTVPDNYTEGVSNTQRYKMLGNGWTIDVISHILKGIK